MATRNWIPVRGAQGQHSRQAHADMPAGAYERQISKEGFFGPAADSRKTPS
jgi:homogentisate 1,2-dioxygenase